MKYRNRLILVLKNLKQRIFVSLLLVCMCLASFYMIDTVLMSYMPDAYTIDKVMSAYGVEPARVGYVDCLDYDNATLEMSDSIKDYLNNHSDVEACGYYAKYTTNDFNDLIDEIGLTMVVCETQLVDLGNLKLTEKEKEELINYSGEYDPVLLGSNYKGLIEVGEVFTLSYYKENTCIVAGFLDEGAAWIKDQQIFGGGSNSDAYTLDDQGILITDRYECYNTSLGASLDVFYILKDASSRQVEADVRRFANENGFSVSVNNHGDVIAEEMESNNITTDKTFVAAILLVVLAVVSMSVASAVYCLLNKKQYGVMMVSGVKQQEIVWMLVVQNAAILVLSAVIAWLVRQQEVFGKLITDPSKELVLFTYMPDYVSHHYYVPPIMVFVIVTMLLISSILPIVFIRRMTLVEMVHGKE